MLKVTARLAVENSGQLPDGPMVIFFCSGINNEMWWIGQGGRIHPPPCLGKGAESSLITVKQKKIVWR